MLELRQVGKRLGAFALADVSFRVKPEDYFVLMGPSGVGKTVLLEIIAGLLGPDQGQVLWEGEEITSLPPERRRFAMAYQDHALFPRMSVEKNIAYGLRFMKLTPEDKRQRVDQFVQMLNIGHLQGRLPDNLSGGEKQRVALARALVTTPRMVLLDEPLSALETRTRLRLRKELKRIHRESGTPFLHVTHDVEEALELADVLAVMLESRVLQVGPPQEVLQSPVSPEVAEFLAVDLD
jgi:ABC-type Fe3+/spermidine/putrescine transport system ATPase subunit